jgi:hypothetical protein
VLGADEPSVNRSAVRAAKVVFEHPDRDLESVPEVQPELDTGEVRLDGDREMSASPAAADRIAAADRRTPKTSGAHRR